MSVRLLLKSFQPYCCGGHILVLGREAFWRVPSNSVSGRHLQESVTQKKKNVDNLEWNKGGRQLDNAPPRAQSGSQSRWGTLQGDVRATAKL